MLISIIIFCIVIFIFMIIIEWILYVRRENERERYYIAFI